jgi:hypothetical protein
MSRTRASLLALISLVLVHKSTSFTIAASSTRRSSRLLAKSAKNEPNEASIDLSSTKSTSSDLKALLPKPSSRPLKLDKFGRRVYKMEDDNTIRLTKGGGSPTNREISSGRSSPELSTLFQSSKEIASLESSANFRSISTSSDLKALLPQREMKWRTLDKYGRRVQKLEDETEAVGIISTRSESDVNNESNGAGSTGTSPPLSELLQSTKEISGYEEAERSFREFDGGGDLKALLPQREMKWRTLDKYGRRVQMMDDDRDTKRIDIRMNAADNCVGGSSVEAVSVESMLPSLDEESDEDVEDTINGRETDANEQFLLDLLKEGDDDEPQPPTMQKSSQNLKDLLPKKPTWTKLDFKGGSVPDERRTKNIPVAASTPDSSLKTLLLQAKKPTWTKLDFKGVGVEDASRTKRVAKEDFNKGQYTNLKTLLPEKKIQWGTRGKVASISDSNVEIGSDSNKGVSLKTLLPERKVTWRDDK